MPGMGMGMGMGMDPYGAGGAGGAGGDYGAGAAGADGAMGSQGKSKRVRFVWSWVPLCTTLLLSPPAVCSRCFVLFCYVLGSRLATTPNFSPSRSGKSPTRCRVPKNCLGRCWKATRPCSSRLWVASSAATPARPPPALKSLTTPAPPRLRTGATLAVNSSSTRPNRGRALFDWCPSCLCLRLCSCLCLCLCLRLRLCVRLCAVPPPLGSYLRCFRACVRCGHVQCGQLRRVHVQNQLVRGRRRR